MLQRLKDKLKELEGIPVRPCDTAFECEEGYDFKAYEVAHAAHRFEIECVQLAITRLETDYKIARAIRSVR